MNKKIVIVTKALAPYRLGFYSEVSKSLKPDGWEVIVIVAMSGAADHPWKSFGEVEEHLKVIIINDLRDDHFTRALSHTLSLFSINYSELPKPSLIKTLNAISPNVIWTHEYSPFCLTASLWAAFRDRHCIASTDLGDSPPRHACSPLHLKFHKLISFLYEAVIANTPEATRRSYPRGAPVLFAPHSIDTDFFHPTYNSQNSIFRFLYVASLRQEKGLTKLIEAAEILENKGYQFTVRVVGSGPLSGWLANLKYKWLSIAGFREGTALRSEYMNSNAYVLPTKGDTYGVTIHEAAASGLPLIVGCNAGAVETLVIDRVSGFSFDPENAHDLCNKMEDLLRNPVKAAEMGRSARKLAEMLDVKILGRRTAKFINQITHTKYS